MSGSPSTPGAIRPPDRSRGVREIAAERQRQIMQEGWTLEHDAEYTNGEMLRAAGCYLQSAIGEAWDGEGPLWPWEASWWKPSDDPIRNLVKAGALIAAEIDRLTAEASR